MPVQPHFPGSTISDFSPGQRIANPTDVLTPLVAPYAASVPGMRGTVRHVCTGHTQHHTKHQYRTYTAPYTDSTGPQECVTSGHV
eukprot:105695-Rhodomonas_salina.1